MLPEMRVNTIAEAAYECLRVWTNAHGKDTIAWKKTPEEIKEQFRGKVKLILTDPRAGDATLHNLWFAQQKEKGWCEGKAYDETHKLDPLMVSFHRLPQEVQANHRALRAIVIAYSRF